MTDVSESFTDEYGTEVIVRKLDGWNHVQLLLKPQRGNKNKNYGFTVADFGKFAAMCLEVDRRVSA